ncbi:hypothetical protein [Microbacterium sp. 77mftsu3.1]|uniref:hypothetical protein n=1 Tax=Microbacterium sp. 77mftsu3.1 TaxID=1761802 RepID=UPI00088C6EA5|nr:hypothetical protein [Microbacterium sp. 77mftsu3.1]SDH54387.1 hypothetical protein SAMN04488590_3529 [Microbacterium sp. 77mftsu3.1]
MLTGLIRDARTVTREVSADSLELAKAALAEAAPVGYELVKAPARMRKGSITLDVTGTFAPRGEAREVEASDLAALRQLIPDGWELLLVRRAG